MAEEEPIRNIDEWKQKYDNRYWYDDEDKAKAEKDYRDFCNKVSMTQGDNNPLIFNTKFDSDY